MARDLALEQTWRDRMEQQERSGLSITDFCRQERLVAHQFSWWRRELKRRGSGMARGKNKVRASRRRKRRASSQVSGFLPVRITATPQASSAIEIVVGRPLRIALGHGFDPEALVELLRLLETRPC